MVHRFDEIAINSTAKKKPEESDRFCYIGLEHIEPGTFEISHWGADAAPVGEKLIMRKGDILFGKRRAYQRKVAIAPFDGIFSAHGMVLRPKEEVICKEYFPFFLSSDQFMDTAIRISVGGLSPTINWKDLQQQEFDLPSLEEQRRLADKLWAAYELKEAYKKMIAATDEMVKAQFIEMFDCSLTIKISDITQTCSGGTPNTKKEEYYKHGTIPWLTSGEVNNGIITATKSYITESGLTNSSAKWIPANSVLIAMYGATAGKSAITKIPITTNQAICALLPSDKVNSVYLYHAIKNKEEWMINQCAGAAQPNISQKIIRDMEIPLPNINKQLEFVSIVEQAEKSKSELRQAIEKIDRVMKSLMQ